MYSIVGDVRKYPLVSVTQRFLSNIEDTVNIDDISSVLSDKKEKSKISVEKVNNMTKKPLSNFQESSQNSNTRSTYILNSIINSKLKQTVILVLQDRVHQIHKVQQVN